MVTRANRRFHLVKPPLCCCFVAIFFVRGNQEKKSEKCGAAVANILRLNSVATTWTTKYITNSFRECRKARPADWLSHRGDLVRATFRAGRLNKSRERST